MEDFSEADEDLSRNYNDDDDDQHVTESSEEFRQEDENENQLKYSKMKLESLKMKKKRTGKKKRGTKKQVLNDGDDDDDYVENCDIQDDNKNDYDYDDQITKKFEDDLEYREAKESSDENCDEEEMEGKPKNVGNEFDKPAGTEIKDSLDEEIAERRDEEADDLRGKEKMDSPRIDNISMEKYIEDDLADLKSENSIDQDISNDVENSDQETEKAAAELNEIEEEDKRRFNEKLDKLKFKKVKKQRSKQIAKSSFDSEKESGKSFEDDKDLSMAQGDDDTNEIEDDGIHDESERHLYEAEELGSEALGARNEANSGHEYEDEIDGNEALVRETNEDIEPDGTEMQENEAGEDRSEDDEGETNNDAAVENDVDVVDDDDDNNCRKEIDNNGNEDVSDFQNGVPGSDDHQDGDIYIDDHSYDEEKPSDNAIQSSSDNDQIDKLVSPGSPQLDNKQERIVTDDKTNVSRRNSAVKDSAMDDFDATQREYQHNSEAADSAFDDVYRRESQHHSEATDSVFGDTQNDESSVYLSMTSLDARAETGDEDESDYHSVASYRLKSSECLDISDSRKVSLTLDSHNDLVAQRRLHGSEADKSEDDYLTADEMTRDLTEDEYATAEERSIRHGYDDDDDRSTIVGVDEEVSNLEECGGEEEKCDKTDNHEEEIEQEKQVKSELDSQISGPTDQELEHELADHAYNGATDDTPEKPKRKQNFFSSMMAKKEAKIKLRLIDFSYREKKALDGIKDGQARIADARSRLPLMIVEERIPKMEACDKMQERLKTQQDRLEALNIFNERVGNYIKNWRELEGEINEKKSEIQRKKKKASEKQKILEGCKKKQMYLETQIMRNEERQISAKQRLITLKDKKEMLMKRQTERRNIIKRYIDGAKRNCELSIRKAAQVVKINSKVQELKTREKYLEDKIYKTRKATEKMRENVKNKRFELERGQIQMSVKQMKKERGW